MHWLCESCACKNIHYITRNELDRSISSSELVDGCTKKVFLFQNLLWSVDTVFQRSQSSSLPSANPTKILTDKETCFFIVIIIVVAIMCGFFVIGFFWCLWSLLKLTLIESFCNYHASMSNSLLSCTLSQKKHKRSNRCEMSTGVRMIKKSIGI